VEKVWKGCRKLTSISLGWVPVAHACSPSYSGGSYQEDQGLRPAMGK
jgi:hypothetical protein